MIASGKARKRIAISLFVASVLVSSAGLAMAYYLPPEQGEMGVVFPPWVSEQDASRAVIEAGGLLVSAGRFSNVVVVYAQDSGFAGRVVQKGAWFIAAARGVCGPLEELTT